MTADGRNEQNLFRLLKAPQTLYIGLTIKITDSVHIKHIQKNILDNIILTWYGFPNDTISGSHIMYEKK